MLTKFRECLHLNHTLNFKKKEHF